jgi:hypothetical protein
MALERVLLDRMVAATGAIAAAGELTTARDAVILDALQHLGELRRAAAALGAELSQVIGARWSDDTSAVRRSGEKSAVLLVARTAGIDPAEAADWCSAGAVAAVPVNLQGEVLPTRYPLLARAIAEARIELWGVRLIAETLDEVAIRAAADDVSMIERVLVDLAPSLSTRELRRLCREAIERSDPDGAEPREDELRRRSGVQVVRCRDGLVKWIITMHPEAAGFLTAAVDARTAPRRQPTFLDSDRESEIDVAVESDDRTLGQKQLDAITSIARESLGRDDGELAGTPVTMVIRMAYEGLIGGIGTARIDGIDTPISAATARRLACDAEIIPVVFGGPSETLDLGRAERLFNRAQRRAIAFRDGGCTWPGCTAPASWCEVAHIVAWLLGGETNLDNGLLLCPFHHRRFDHDGWGFEWRDGAPYFIPPPWLDAARRPRRGGRARLVA